MTLRFVVENGLWIPPYFVAMWLLVLPRRLWMSFFTYGLWR